jgi:hypothetical protein
MKIFLSTLVALTFTIQLTAADGNASALSKTNSLALLKIGATDATNHYDQMMIVTGKVAQVTIRPNVTFLNLDQPFPDSPFEIVIIHGHSSYYGDANALKGKSVEIRGRIKKYHDKPEMMLDDTNQLTVLNFTNSVTLTNAPAIQSPVNAPPVAPSTNGLPEIM